MARTTPEERSCHWWVSARLGPRGGGSSFESKLLSKTLPLHARGHLRLHKETAVLVSKTAPAAAAAWNQIVKALDVPSYVY